MALQGIALKHALGFSRLLAGSLSRANDGMLSVSSSSTADEKEAHEQRSTMQVPDLVRAMSTNALRTKVSSLPLLSKRQGIISPLGMAASGALMGGSQSRSPIRLPFQVRHLNAWSPAQRYFVEGDHVIQAEINRTFQFTGLDSGSFYPFVVYTTIATAIATVFMVVPWLVAPQRVDLDKSSAYECGFDAFGEARQTFSVSFYLVSIMYLLFDIEICYLFPYVMCHANAQMFWTMNLFLSLLVVGFVYEWGVGALEWRS